MTLNEQIKDRMVELNKLEHSLKKQNTKMYNATKKEIARPGFQDEHGRVIDKLRIIERSKEAAINILKNAWFDTVRK